ncbi:ester cyclase [Microbacterium sp. PRC9]|uniref:ester cyclase n=1 Tax=Microbacterium sp. PRC9 TaxID=2962591 RepID=UPI0037CADC24
MDGSFRSGASPGPTQVPGSEYPPTGKDVSIYGIDLARVVDGRIVEIRHVEELLQLQMQLAG